MASSLYKVLTLCASVAAGGSAAYGFNKYGASDYVRRSEPFIRAVEKSIATGRDTASLLQFNIEAAQRINLWDSWISGRKVNQIIHAGDTVRAMAGVMPDKYAADCTEAATDAKTQAIDLSSVQKCFSIIAEVRAQDYQNRSNSKGLLACAIVFVLMNMFKPQGKKADTANCPSRGLR